MSVDGFTPLLTLQVGQPLGDELAERHAIPPPPVGVLFQGELLLAVRADQLKHPAGRLGLGQGAIGRTSTVAMPAAGPVRFDPRRPDRPDHRLPLA